MKKEKNNTTPLITVKTTIANRDKIGTYARKEGMTISGMIRKALKQVFNIEI